MSETPQKPEPQKPIEQRLGPREKPRSQNPSSQSNGGSGPEGERRSRDRLLAEDMAVELALCNALTSKVKAEAWDALARLSEGEMPERENLEHWAQALGPG